MLKVGGLSFSSWKEKRKIAGAREAVAAGQLCQAGTDGRLDTAGTKAVWLIYSARRRDRPCGGQEWMVRNGEMEK